METKAERTKREEKEQKLADEQAAYDTQREEDRQKAVALKAEEDQKKRAFDRGPKASIGRIVIYTHTHLDISPAIVRRVNTNDTVDLFIFMDTGYLIQRGVLQGVGAEEWNWPVKV